MLIRKLGIVSRTYRHINRYRQILTVLFRYGFGDLIDRLNVGQYFEIGLQLVSKRRREHVEKLTGSERVRMALEDLGPTFVKMGQVLSTRPDLIPVEFVHELSKLQDSVPPFPFSQAKEIVEAELELPINKIFEKFEQIPMAAASIGQVHRAKLKSGEDVVVKVQRPGIRSSIEVDLEILMHLATLAEKHIENAELYGPTRIVEEFSHTIEKEIDYTIEASNAERFGRQFSDSEIVHIPRIYRNFSTKHVLTMEFVDGLKASNIDKLDEEKFDRKIIASRGADLILEQIFKNGFFHADPHPGNILILPDNVISYIDFGMMGYVGRRTREDFADVVYGYVRKDESKIADALLRITRRDVEPDRVALETDIADFVESYLYKSLKELRIGDLFRQLMELIRCHRLRFPPDVFLMIKAIVEVEGLGLTLDPDFDMTKKAAPFIRHLRMDRLSPGRIVGDFLDSGGEFVQLLKIIPGEIRDILGQLKQGKIKISFEHKGLEILVSAVDKSSNRISFSFIVASIIIGSSLIIRTNAGPHLFGLPMLGLMGFAIAGVFGMWLLIAIIRSGKL